jgi:proteasome lid subunit RPN8/RPN11
MKITLSQAVLEEIQQHGMENYPEEGAGVILGEQHSQGRQAKKILALTNHSENGSRHNRYLIAAKDILKAENEAEKLGLEVIGVFHSHPDHPAEPSEFDLQWALPWYSYLITRVESDRAVETKSWRLNEDRQTFSPEILVVSDSNPMEALS